MQLESHANLNNPLPDALSTISIDHLRETFPALHLVRTSRMIRTVGKLTFAFLVLSLIAMFFAPWQQTSRGFGDVVAVDPQFRTQDVESQYDGIVKFVKPGLKEGSVVKAGELLLELEPFAVREQEQLATQIEQMIASRAASAGTQLPPPEARSSDNVATACHKRAIWCSCDDALSMRPRIARLSGSSFWVTP